MRHDANRLHLQPGMRVVAFVRVQEAVGALQVNHLAHARKRQRLRVIPQGFDEGAGFGGGTVLEGEVVVEADGHLGTSPSGRDYTARRVQTGSTGQVPPLPSPAESFPTSLNTSAALHSAHGERRY